jgi:glycosyltransferase involved in cell wall biosynthesis
MNLLVISACFPPAWSWGGPVRSIWNVCRGLRLAGARVRVVTTDADLHGTLDVEPRREEAGIPITTCRIPRWGGRAAARFGFAPGLGRALAEELPTAELSVVQGPWTYLLALAGRRCRAARVPYVICPRGALERLSLSEKSAKKRVYMTLVERRAIAGAAAIQFASEMERERSLAAVRGRPSFVCENAVEVAATVEPDPAGLRAELGVAADEPLLGLSGRVHPRKGFEVIVAALARSRRPLHLVSFGSDEGGHRARIEALARRVGVASRLHFLGALAGERLQQAYASVDLLVMPSVGESFGNAALEALGQGTEALVSDRVPVGRYVVEHGFGAVVEGLDPGRWAEAIETRLARGARADRKRMAARVRVDYDVKAKGEELLARYRGLVDRAGEGG